jgi:hypothetical protein
MKCNPTACIFSDGVGMICFLLPALGWGGGSGSALTVIIWHVPHGSRNVLQCRMPYRGCPHVAHVAQMKAKKLPGHSVAPFDSFINMNRSCCEAG